MSQKWHGDEWVSPAMIRTLELMQDRDLQIIGWRGREGNLRYALTNNEIVHPQTVQALLKRGLLEMTDTLEEVNRKGEVTYRLKVK